MEQQEQPVGFRDMFHLSNYFFKLVGVCPLFDHFVRTRVMGIVFMLSFANLVITYFAEYMFIITAFGDFENFLQLIAIIPCICYVTMGINAMVVITLRRSLMVSVNSQLEMIFPKTLEEQRSQSLLTKKKQSDRFLLGFSTVFMFLISTFNFSPIVESIVDYLRHGAVNKVLPYPTWYPFDSYDNRYFPYVYIHHIWAGYTTVFAVLGELFQIGAGVLQLTLQFERVALEIGEHRPERSKDEDFIPRLVKKHNHILNTAHELADIVSPTIFLSQMCSSVVICCSGFQVVASENLTMIFKFSLLLFCSLIQSIVVSYLGNEIIKNVRNSSGTWRKSLT